MTGKNRRRTVRCPGAAVAQIPGPDAQPARPGPRHLYRLGHPAARPLSAPHEGFRRQHWRVRRERRAAAAHAGFWPQTRYPPPPLATRRRRRRARLTVCSRDSVGQARGGSQVGVVANGGMRGLWTGQTNMAVFVCSFFFIPPGFIFFLVGRARMIDFLSRLVSSLIRSCRSPAENHLVRWLSGRTTRHPWQPTLNQRLPLSLPHRCCMQSRLIGAAWKSMSIPCGPGSTVVKTRGNPRIPFG